MIRLRYSLLPYIYSTSWEVTHRQSTFMRALVMDFPRDKKVWNMNDEYMFGKAFLVAPVLEAQYTPEKVVKVDEESVGTATMRGRLMKGYTWISCNRSLQRSIFRQGLHGMTFGQMRKWREGAP